MNVIQERMDEQDQKMMDQINQLRMDPYFTFDLDDYHDHYNCNADAETARYRYTAENIQLWEAIELDWDLKRWNEIVDKLFN